jgi:hypothetical protein
MPTAKPTKTEQLLYGSKGSTDARDPFRLERDLIGSDKWQDRYDEMPPKVQRTVDRIAKDPWSEGCSIGIGHNEEVGWFILGCGQGPFLIWIEKE